MPETLSGPAVDLLISRIKSMPWKNNYTVSDEISLSDKEIVWPGDNRCCLNVVVDLSLASGPEGLVPSDLTTPDAVFAMGDGLAGVLVEEQHVAVLVVDLQQMPHEMERVMSDAGHHARLRVHDRPAVDGDVHSLLK